MNGMEEDVGMIDFFICTVDYVSQPISLAIIYLSISVELKTHTNIRSTYTHMMKRV